LCSSRYRRFEPLSDASQKIVVVADLPVASLQALLARYELGLVVQPDGEAITGSFWGDEEAGIVGYNVYVRSDTPIHSLLHESCHTICMSADRREQLDRDAGGDDLEEEAVCYLQVVLADEIESLGRRRLMRDMDAWGYSFRLGSTAKWFSEDSGRARKWLIGNGLLSRDGQPIYSLRA